MTDNEITLPEDDREQDDIQDDLPRDDLEYLAMVSDYSIDKIINRIEGRIRNAEHERIRAQYLSKLSTHIRTRLKIREHREIDRMADEIEELRGELEAENR